MTDRTAIRILGAGLLCLLLGVASVFLHVDHDLFHEMAHVREALQRHALVGDDSFAFTPTVSPVIHHEWGTGAVLYCACVIGGLGAPGLLVLKYLLVAGIAVACFLSAHRRGARGVTFALLSPVAMMLSVFALTTIRAQVFTMLFTALLLWLLSDDWRGKRRWVLGWLPLFLVWLNMHGGFVVGVGLYGLHGLERLAHAARSERSLRGVLSQTGHLAAGLFAMTGLTLVNPYGADYPPFILRATMLHRPYIGEWARLWEMPLPQVMVPLFGLSLVLAVYAAFRKGLGRVPDITLLLAAALMAVLHIRHLPIYAVVWLCCVPAYLEGTAVATLLKRMPGTFPRLVAAAGLLLVASGLNQAVRNRFWEVRVPTAPEHGKLAYPAGAVNYLAETKFSGNLIVPFLAGGYVSWRLHPRVLVNVDSRYEVAYPPEQVEEFIRLYARPEDCEQTLRRYPAQGILVQRGDALEGALEKPPCETAEPRWTRVYWDDAYALYLRSDISGSYPVVDRTGQTIHGTFP